MKNHYLAILYCFFASALIAQNSNDTTQTMDVNIQISSTDYSSSVEQLNTFAAQNPVIIIQRNESRRELHIDFTCKQNEYTILESLLPKLGYIESRKITSTNTFEKRNTLETEIAFLNSRILSYADLLKNSDAKSSNYMTVWNEMKMLEERKFRLQQELQQIHTKENGIHVQITISDDATRTDTKSVSFINMPGMEYNMLFSEKYIPNNTAKLYSGLTLKYLFTKGKTYAGIGLYKAQDQPKTDTASTSELFTMYFGQDFYSRYMGRGSRKYLNLYSSYSIGAVFATSTIKKNSYLFISPGIGMEWFKNKYILIDSKASYMVPLDPEINLRGLLIQSSFNFVF